MKDDPTQDLSYAYVTVVTDFNSMPDEIRVLLISETTDDIEARCCPFDRILVRDTDDKTILGQYVAEDNVGEDCLLHYRKIIDFSLLLPCLMMTILLLVHHCRFNYIPPNIAF